MARRNSTVKVYPNPYKFLDAFGNPSGVFPHENSFDYVGARISEVDVLDKFEKGDPRTPRQDTFFSFDLDEPTQVPRNAYYRQGIQSGSLIAADEDAAVFAGVDYQDPDAALSKASAEAHKAWRDTYGVTCPGEGYKPKSKKSKATNDSVVIELPK